MVMKGVDWMNEESTKPAGLLSGSTNPHFFVKMLAYVQEVTPRDSEDAMGDMFGLKEKLPAQVLAWVHDRNHGAWEHIA